MQTKTYVLILLAVMLFSSYIFAQRGIRIGYVDMEYILENVEEYREATEQLENKAQQWKVEIEQKQNAVDQMKKDLQAERVLLTDELIAEREEEIQILEKQLIEYQQDRFGPQGDLVLQKKRLIQPIQDQVFNEVQKIGANKKYDFIFDKSADVVMLYSENRWDISDLVLRGIARTRKISPPKNEADSRNALQESEAEEALEEEALKEEVSEAIQERQQQAEEAQEARAKTADERRAEQLKLREERKKAYEARRKKLLEEREAKRQERLEEREQMKDSVQ